MRIIVVIPSYQRPASLHRCLKGLEAQERLPEAVVVVSRRSDEATRGFLRKTHFGQIDVREVTVSEPGNLAAYNAGLETATGSDLDGDVVAFTDDDTIPHPDWLVRIAAHFHERPRVGGVGGRDWMYVDGVLQDASMHPGAEAPVGRIQWQGRIAGNHHLGEGSPREVDVLKGANMSFRREALADLRFDERLRGIGSHPGNDFMLSHSVKQHGWQLLYDPAVAVDHHLGERLDKDVRPGMGFSFEQDVIHAHNETLFSLEHLPPHRKAAFLLWSVLVGTRDNFGLLQFARFLPKLRTIAAKKLMAALLGRMQGIGTFLRSR